ncbi:Uncharacterised protein [Mycobacteroides abscessus subsp. abscessus]|nr:Uncharacterised protein [Mycobacteroides abscessus subsp. abscessus]
MGFLVGGISRAVGPGAGALVAENHAARWTRVRAALRSRVLHPAAALDRAAGGCRALVGAVPAMRAVGGTVRAACRRGAEPARLAVVVRRGVVSHGVGQGEHPIWWIPVGPCCIRTGRQPNVGPCAVRGSAAGVLRGGPRGIRGDRAGHRDVPLVAQPFGGPGWCPPHALGATAGSVCMSCPVRDGDQLAAGSARQPWRDRRADCHRRRCSGECAPAGPGFQRAAARRAGLPRQGDRPARSGCQGREGPRPAVRGVAREFLRHRSHPKRRRGRGHQRGGASHRGADSCGWRAAAPGLHPRTTEVDQLDHRVGPEHRPRRTS